MNYNNFFINILTSTDTVEIIALVVTAICLISFCAVFTILFRNYYKHNIQDIVDGKDDIELIDNALYLEQQSKNKVKKAFKITGKVLSWLIFGVVVVGFGMSLASRFTNNNMMFGNTSYIVIASGSMSEAKNDYVIENNLTNQIQTYDMVEIKKVNSPADIKLYDVIAYKANDGRTIVHRVIEITPENTYITRGDAVNTSDSGDPSLYETTLPFDRIVGKYTNKRVPIIGLFVIFLQSNAGIITIVSIIYCMAMFDHYRIKCDKAIEKRTNMLIDLINYDMKKEEADDIASHFKHLIVYKGKTYTFEDGKFVSKEDETPNGISNIGEEDMICIKEHDEKRDSIKIRNVEKDINVLANKKNTDKE